MGHSLVACVRSVLVLVSLLLAALTLSAAPVRGAPAADWQPTGLTIPAHRLFAPASGALLAAGDDRLLRSDDGGDTWRDIPLPPNAELDFEVHTSYRPAHFGQGRLAVDPTNHDVIYAASIGLHKTVDGGATWTPLPTPFRTVSAAVSPADPAVVHAVVATDTREWQRLRSHDGGETWEQMASFADQTPANRPPLDYAIYFLQPHPTDPDRLFVAAGGTTGRNTQVGLYDGYDGPGPRPGPELKFDPGYFIDAEHLVGGGGAAPGRYYAAFNQRVSPYNQVTETELLRADEGGPQTTLLEVQGGGDLNRRAAGDVLKPAVFVDALAYDPAAPDLVYAGLNEYQVVVVPSGSLWSVDLTRARSHVLASTDGGATWADLGQENLGAEIHDVALGVDGANLYAATTAGVLRLALP